MCNHKRRGIVTNQDPRQPWDPSRSHASTSVCDREECVAKAMRWVASKTNETAAFYADPIRAGAR